jgi:hypothetical protein
MPVGRPGPITDDISDLGFKISNTIHILGMDIDAELSNLDSNFEKTLESVRRSVEFWERYNLSLPGRINVIKSLLFPLILYLGSIIMPSKRKLNELQKMLDEYATGTMNFSRSRVCLPANAGGMGLFDVEEFLTAQQAIWIIRANHQPGIVGAIGYVNYETATSSVQAQRLLTLVRTLYYMVWQKVINAFG